MGRGAAGGGRGPDQAKGAKEGKGDKRTGAARTGASRDRWRLGGGGGRRGSQQLARPRQAAGPVGRGVKAVVADADEALGQDVKQVAAEKFRAGQGDAPGAGGGGAGADGEGDRLRADGDQAMVGEANAVGVAAEVAEERSRTPEGPFGEDDPAFGTLGGQVQAEPTKAGAEKAAEAFGQRLDGDEEGGSAREPGGVIRGESAGGDNAVQMGVEGEILGPRVEDQQEAGKGAEEAGIGGEFEQGLGAGLEQQVVERAGMAEEKGAQAVRHGEDDMEMRDGEDAGQRAFNPLGAFTPLAFWAVAIAAGIVGKDLNVGTGGADLDMTAQLGGPAGG